jgi:hypothetical protein
VVELDKKIDFVSLFFHLVKIAQFVAKKKKQELVEVFETILTIDFPATRRKLAM